jgi:hypothetical protein
VSAVSNWNPQNESEKCEGASAGAAPEPKNPWASFIAGMESRAAQDECCQGACSEEFASELDAVSDRAPELVTPEHSLPAMPASEPAEAPAAEEKKAKKAVAKKKPAKKAAAKKKPAKKAAAKKKPAKKAPAKKKAVAAAGEPAEGSATMSLLPPTESAA